MQPLNPVEIGARMALLYQQRAKTYTEGTFKAHYIWAIALLTTMAI
jgi:hypothetical protein